MSLLLLFNQAGGGSPAPVVDARWAPEWYSPNEKYLLPSESQLGKVYGPNGNDFTGTAEFGSGGDCAGTGARTVTVTVIDALGDPLENALVRLNEGASTAVASTNASGVAELYVDDATHKVVITKFGYTGLSASLVVAADVTAEYTLTAVVITAPADADRITGWAQTFSGGVLTPGVNVYARMLASATVVGQVHVGRIVKAISNSDSIVEFPQMFLGATYRIWTDDEHCGLQITAPLSGTEFELTTFIGGKSS